MEAKTSDTKQLQSDRSGESGCSNRPNDCVEYAVTAAQRLRSTGTRECSVPSRGETSLTLTDTNYVNSLQETC